MIKYFENKEKGTIIAVISNCGDDLTRFVERRIAIPDKFRGLLRMPNTVFASTTCREGDTYSLETGKKIAKDKVLEKYYRMRDKRLERFKDAMRKEYTDFLAVITARV